MSSVVTVMNGMPVAARTHAIRVDRLAVHYGQKVAIQDISLSCASNSITALIGPSGCGKTTLLSCLNRLTDLIPDCKVSGDVNVGEWNLFGRQMDLIALRQSVGMIFQRPNPFPLSIRRNLELPLKEHGARDRQQIAQQIERTLVAVGLWDEVKDRLDRSALLLSGGQQQRLCLARALVLNPKVLLLDEPCSSLDPVSGGIIEELLVQLRQTCSLLLVTHNLPQARRIADQTAFLWSDANGGRLIESGDTRQLFESPLNPLTAAFISGKVG